MQPKIPIQAGSQIRGHFTKEVLYIMEVGRGTGGGGGGTYYKGNSIE